MHPQYGPSTLHDPPTARTSTSRWSVEGCTAETLDLWGKRQHRHCGQVHDPVLGPREIFAAVPESISYSASSERYLDWQEIPVEVAREEAPTLLDRLDSDTGERRPFEEIAGAIEAHGLTYNGTVICRIAVLDR